MKHTYLDLVKQNYSFPQEGFDLKNDNLTFHGISLKYLIGKYGTPFKLMYLPHIGKQINRARNLFNNSIKKNNYKGKYHYCYCTKCCHFSHVVKAALREKAHLETSSSFDVDLIFKLYEEGELNKDTTLIHNGYKTEDYLKKIIQLNKEGFQNSIIVLDSKAEIKRIKKYAGEYGGILKIGIRIATEEEAQSAYSTSRLGIRPSEIIDFYKAEIKDDENLVLKMVHFFIDSGIKDSTYYWSEFQKVLKLFVALKQQCNNMNALNLGGGFPIKNNLDFNYDYEYIINKIVSNIKSACEEAGIDEPDIFTEFGKYTIGESGATIFEILEQKQQSEKDLWYIINNSLMTTIPDIYTINEKFITLPINKWNNTYKAVNVGGISCDYYDFYNSDHQNKSIHLPTFQDNEKEPLYIGFFHTGAYQDSLSVYGGVKYCLIPTPKIIFIDVDESGKLVETIYSSEQSAEGLLNILDY